MSVNGLCNPPQESMNWSKELPTEYEYEFDPTDPDAPAAGNGLPVVRHNVYDCIELCGDQLPSGLLLFKMIFFCRKATMTLGGKRWYVRSRESLCLETRLTRHQYDRALSSLKMNGFVVTRRLPLTTVSIFGNVTAFRVTPEAIKRLEEVRNKRGPVVPKKKRKMFMVRPLVRHRKSVPTDIQGVLRNGQTVVRCAGIAINNKTSEIFFGRA
jgi:hypothetical protein